MSERLTLTPTDSCDNFLFGCGQNNQGLLGNVARLLGLGWYKISVVSQTSQKYGRVFSYCLPSTSSSNGNLSFSNTGGRKSSLKFTSLSQSSPSFYTMEMLGISVDGQKLSILASAYSKAGMIIDLGTVITQLPPAAYSTLRSAF